jgi:hypothetical protein
MREDEVTRRLLLAGIVGVGALAPEPADACSFVARQRPTAFSDAACRRSLAALIALVNAAPGLDDAALERRLADTSISFDQDVTDPILNYPQRSPIEDAELIRGWSVSAGRRDDAPLRLAETTLLKGDPGIALYQFALKRRRWIAEVTEEEAAGDSCGIAAPAHWRDERTSYLGLFRNNRLREVHAFGIWDSAT